MNQRKAAILRELSFDDHRYHSGLPRTSASSQSLIRKKRGARQPAIRIEFCTAKYFPPLDMGVSTDHDWERILPMIWSDSKQAWSLDLVGPEFETSFHFKIRLGSVWMQGDDFQVEEDVEVVTLTDDNVYLTHHVLFVTDRWRPNHRITLRAPTDGWGRDVFGDFHTPQQGPGTWRFEIDRASFAKSNMSVRFVLDRQHHMLTDDLPLSMTEGESVFTDEDIEFPVEPNAYVHAYDNLVAEESLWEQRIVPPRTRPTPNKVYDVIVVGSGIAGGTLADKTSELGLETLVLEAGGLGYPIHMNGLPRSEVNPISRDELGSFHQRDEGDVKTDFAGGLVFNLGGRSNYWAGIIPEMQPWEFGDGVWPERVKDYLLERPSDGLSGYELANAQLKKQVSLGPYQDKVVALLQRQLSAYTVEILPRSMHQPHLDSHGQLVNVLQRSTGAYSTSDLLLDSLGFRGFAGERHLDLALHHLTTRIEPQHGHVVAHCQDLVGNEDRVFVGRHLVLCCGSVESPRLAMQSGLTDPSLKMGRGLTDHAAYTYRHKPLLPTSGSLGWLGDVRGHAKVMIRAKDQTNQPFNMEVLINSMYWDMRHADAELSELAEPADARVEIKFIYDSPLDDDNYILPQGEGRKPFIHVKKNLHAEPHFTAMVQARNEIFRALGVPSHDLSTEWSLDEWYVGNSGSVQHSGGSMRMHEDPSQGVVDADLKLHGYDAIYCCDASVFPSIPAANPSLTVAALALRLAGHLGNTLHR